MKIKLETFINRFWYSKKKFLHAIAYLLAVIFAPLYLFILILVSCKFVIRQLHKTKRQICTNNLKIIVIGNITAGGTGKTPCIISLAQAIEKTNLQVAIVCSGYKSKIATRNDYHLVKITDSSSMIGDEAKLIKTRLPKVLLLVGNRKKAISYLQRQNQTDIILCDDGLQNTSLARDFEIALIDQYRLFGNGLLLPFGPLREPKSFLHKADAIAYIEINQNINKRELPLSTLAITKELYFLFKNNIISLTLVVTGFYNISTKIRYSVSDFQNKVVNNSVCFVCFAGLANPERFFMTFRRLINLKNNKVKYTPLQDHQRYSKQIMQRLQEEDADCYICTEKDAVKIQELHKLNYKMLSKTWVMEISLDVGKLQKVIKI